MIIGITGTNGSGKDTVADFLIQELSWDHFSLSDELREISKERNIEPTRDNLIALGREVRETFGLDYLSQRIFKKAKDNFIATSIRNPGEVELFKKTGKFVLVAVDAPVEIRYQRVIKSGQSREGYKPGEEEQTLEEFISKENKEMIGSGAEQQLQTLLDMADTKIENSGTIEELEKKIKELTYKGGIMNRPGWDDYFIDICSTVAKRATCDRGRSGSVIVKNKRILSTGYVGSPIGAPHCDEVGHEFKDTIHKDGKVTKHCVRTTHAEQNAICQAARFGIPIEGGTVYCKMTPCYVCAKMIINSGIKRVVAEMDYHAGDDTKRIFKEAGIQFDIVNQVVEEYAGQTVKIAQ